MTFGERIENLGGAKRIIGYINQILLVIIVIYHLQTHFNVQIELIYTVAGLIVSALGLNALVAIKDLAGKSAVATEMAKSNTKDPAVSKAQELVSDSKSTPAEDEKIIKEADDQGIKPWYPEEENKVVNEYTPD